MAHLDYTTRTERVKVWLDSTTLHIRFDNPARHNALSVDMWEAVPVLLAQAEQDRRVRLVRIAPKVLNTLKRQVG